MSFRSIILGILGAVFIATVGYFNDQIPRLEHFVGHFFPLAVFLPLLVLCGAINPLLRRVGWPLKAGELAVMMTFWLVGCNLPGSGLLRMWSRNIVVPVYYNQQRPGWQQARVLETIPPQMLPNEGVYDEAFISQVMAGEGRVNLIPPRDIPWEKWAGPVQSWMPLVLAFAVASIALSLMVHRVWADNERLPYPVAQVAMSILDVDPARPGGSIFRQKPFLIALAIVFGIHVVNGLNAWFNGALIQIPVRYEFNEVVNAFPRLKALPWPGNALFHLKLVPTVIAFAVFVAGDVGFSLGISAVAMALVAMVAMEYGLDFGAGPIDGGVFSWQAGGSFLAIAAMLLYYGRRHYWGMLKGALGLSGAPAARREVWACRVLGLSLAAAVALLVHLGLDWVLAVPLVLLFMLGYLVFARINAESGLFLVDSRYAAVALLVALFGVPALGLKAIALMGFISIVFAHDIRECLMPMVLNGLQVCRATRIPTGRTAWMGAGVFAIALAAAVPFSIWIDHNYGLAGGENWSTTGAPAVTFNFITQQHDLLSRQDNLGLGDGLAGLERLGAMKPNPLAVKALIVGFVAVIVLSFLRLRYRWWPIHPILLLVWGTWGMYETAGAFLVGWAIKKVALGMGVRYSRLKTFMIGAIAGDLLGGAVWMIAGFIYWLITKHTAPRYDIFPGG
ncbi:MAG: hypothetical protein NTV86_06080 [Planctomycetota bacterium]|nr:hypothetical protein [Planctomycetota bacterium]